MVIKRFSCLRNFSWRTASAAKEINQLQRWLLKGRTEIFWSAFVSRECISENYICPFTAAGISNMLFELEEIQFWRLVQTYFHKFFKHHCGKLTFYLTTSQIFPRLRAFFLFFELGNSEIWTPSSKFAWNCAMHFFIYYAKFSHHVQGRCPSFAAKRLSRHISIEHRPSSWLQNTFSRCQSFLSQHLFLQQLSPAISPILASRMFEISMDGKNFVAVHWNNDLHRF